MTVFRIGQQVVCVDSAARIFCGKRYPTPLVYKQVYEIAQIVDCPDGPAIVLAGVDHKPATFGFWRDRFRPVQYDTTKAVEAIKASLPKLKRREKVEP